MRLTPLKVFLKVDAFFSLCFKTKAVYIRTNSFVDSCKEYFSVERLACSPILTLFLLEERSIFIFFAKSTSFLAVKYPFLPFITISHNVLSSTATTGSPAVIASIGAIPCVSVLEEKIKTSASAYTWGINSGLIKPGK